MAARLTMEDFAGHLHTRFQVAEAAGTELELSEATDLSNAALEQFSLLFTGALSPWLPQGTYKLAHGGLGELELFLTPLGPDSGRMRYEAVFSRFHER